MIIQTNQHEWNKFPAVGGSTTYYYIAAIEVAYFTNLWVVQ